jgi:hypothetical protein
MVAAVRWFLADLRASICNHRNDLGYQDRFFWCAQIIAVARVTV